MHVKPGFWPIVLAVFLGACSSAGSSNSAAARSDQLYAGWYMQHAGHGQFTPCGQQTALPVSPSPDLLAQAKAFGLEDDMPVYARLRGELRDAGFVVSAVEQFGSPRPVRDCPLEGVVTHST